MKEAIVPTLFSALFPPHPRLPAPLAWPLALLPEAVHSTALAAALNILLAEQIQQGEFAFLRQRTLLIEVRDARITYRLSLINATGFTAGPTAAAPDLTISGALYDFLALATRREDSDTLFFHRRVVMAGDTALGLELKNWLDGADLEALGGLLPPLLRAATGLISAYERLSGA
ncbi:MAG: SCP2 sterol-binding domain-containing protein [Candidatus Competibacteraceae bacterium]|nr:SCP2 sterol-binding domain-containing protein [Candidatus Competibacteraceae bacterium]MCB1920774.1 SCP2 sterol-binding domain-containing protein [Candidatus Competibacteraceae bacterium]MCP5127296.1 SCP2 sterol-binding domain-containing protein [Gammaproteobacteria bacterium]